MVTNGNDLTKEQIQAIKDYDKEIKTIELFVDSVRQNPGEYLSSIRNEGWMNAVREVIQNSTDEMNRDESPCNYVKVEYFEVINRCIVTDNGRALSRENIVRVFTREHTSTNFIKKKGVYSSGLHGVGSKCTNAVSKRFSVTSYRLGKGYHIDFSEGKPLPEYKMIPKEIPNPNNIQGLVVDFEPDKKIMKEITLQCEDILLFLENLVPLLKINATIEFIGHKSDKKTVIRKILVNETGIGTFLVRATDKPYIRPIIFGDEYDGEMKCEIAITFESDINKGANVITFANMTPVNTQLSTPSQGFFQGLQTFFRNYMNKVYIPTFKRKVEIINSDVTTGLIGVVSASHINVMFDGQAKNVCKNIELTDFVKQVTMQNLAKWSKERPEDLQKLCEFFRDVATARSKIDKEKINVSKKYKTSSFVDLPEKYKKAENKEGLELYILEGDSASASASAGRDTRYQAIFPIRGKMPNAFSTTKEKFLQNAEVQAILTILNNGNWGKNFDINKCPFDRVVILADADYDGYHIRTLVLKFLLLYCRPLIEYGRLYIGLSPLYHIDKGKKTWTYYIDKDDFNKYVRDQFYKNNKIQHISNKKDFNKSELLSLIINNRDYKSYMDTISTNNAIHPILLEDILIVRNESFNKIKKFIENKYPYLKVYMKNNTVLIDGIAFDATQAVVLNDFLISSCNILTSFLDNSEKRYIINGNTVGLYEMLDIYTQSEPKNIERAKGIGALNPYELGYSTLDPKNRKLLRYTTTDIIQELETMRKVNDDKFTLIKDLDLSQYEF